jgi:hypothetical protein
MNRYERILAFLARQDVPVSPSVIQEAVQLSRQQLLSAFAELLSQPCIAQPTALITTEGLVFFIEDHSAIDFN